MVGLLLFDGSAPVARAVFPALRANPTITYVVGVDPRTGAECFKWKRADLPDPPQPPCAEAVDPAPLAQERRRTTSSPAL